MMTRKALRHHFAVRFLTYPAAISAYVLIYLTPISASAFEVLLGTGPEGTFSHFTGRTICRAISRHAADIACKTMPAPDAIHNLTNLQGGSLDLGLIDSRMLTDAINKTGVFEYLDIRYDNLSALVPLYDRPLTLIVRSDSGIGSLNDLAGKRINAGAPRSEEHLATNAVMTAKNWTKGDFSLFGELSASMSQGTMAFCHGEVEAMFHIGVHPDPMLQQLLELCSAELVDMNDKDIVDLVGSDSALSAMDIPAQAYPSLQKAIATFGTTVFLIASGSLDDQGAYKIMEALDSYRQYLNSAHSALNAFNVEKGPKRSAGLPHHPGATLYLSTHGN